MEDIIAGCGNLNLRSEENETVTIDEGKPIMTSENVQLCTVGKIHTNKRISVEAFKSVMKSVWNVHDSTRIETIGMNIFVFLFKSLREKIRVLNSGPWTFNKSFLVLSSPTATDQPLEMNFNICAFWVQVHNIPFECMLKEMAVLLGGKLGEVEEVECEGPGGWAGPFLRTRVKIDISKPLRRGMKIRSSEGKYLWYPIRYEKLLDFCYDCGMIGHSSRACDNRSTVHQNQYDDWLHATLLNKSTRYQEDGFGIRGGRFERGQRSNGGRREGEGIGGGVLIVMKIRKFGWQVTGVRRRKF